MIDLLQIPNLLDAAACAALRAELAAAAGSPATVLSEEAGGTVRTQVRRTTRLPVAPQIREQLTELMMARRDEIAAHFGAEVSGCEEPQFLRYGEGDYFVAHQDGNTPLVWDDSRFRRISLVLFLSTPSEQVRPGTYGGGSLVLHGPLAGPELRMPLNPTPGTLVAFRAETTHEVTPVTHGERYTVVSWLRA
jgi:SM-20-related protein